MNSSALFKWTKEYMIEVLTTGHEKILTDPILINAIQKIDRKFFVPEDYKNKAYDDIEIPIGYNEKLSKPTIITQMIVYLKPKLGGKYLDIGTGTGYSAAIMAFVAGDSGMVYSIERVQWIWEIAWNNLKKYPHIRNVKLLNRDGIAGLPNQAPFDGIHIAFSIKEIPEHLKMQLNPNGGILVCPMEDNYLKIIVRNGIDDFKESKVQGFLMDRMKAGTA